MAKKGALGSDPDIVKRLLEQKQLRDYANRGQKVTLAEAQNAPAIENPTQYVVLATLRFPSGGTNLKYDAGTIIRDPFVIEKIKRLGLDSKLRAIA